MAERILLIGSGLSAMAAARLARSRQAEVALCDDRDLREERKGELRELGVTVLAPAQAAAFLEEDGTVLPSPAVPMSHGILKEARRLGRRIQSEISYSRSFFDGRLTGITGSNGKSTVTALTAHVLQQAGRKAEAGGNIGLPFAELALRTPPVEHAVLELSSYQLETTDELQADCALLLNLSPDHLERHGSLEAYGKAKLRLAEQLRPDGCLVLGRDAAFFAEGTKGLKRRRLFFGRSPDCAIWREGSVIHFPEAGLKDWLREEDLILRGSHNLDNAMAAALACFCAGLGAEETARGLSTFHPLAHRLEPVASRHPAHWINDSKATNVDAGRMAILSVRTGGLWLLAGGEAKGPDFSLVRDCLQGRGARVICYGRHRDWIREGLSSVAEVRCLETLEEAVAQAAREAGAGDTVLFSPLCASFDQYRNFVERGEHFRRLVEELQ